MEKYDKLLQKALSLLVKHRYTVLKLKEKLVSFYEKQIEKGEWPPVSKVDKEKIIREVLNRLKELKYLDDTQYAKDFITTRLEFRPRGKFLLKKELRRKGIHPDLVERIAEETEMDEEAIATKVLQKKLKQFSSDPIRKQREKALRFLASRGFKLEAIYKAVESCYNGDRIG